MKGWILSLALCSTLLLGQRAVGATDPHAGHDHGTAQVSTTFEEGVQYQRVNPPQATQDKSRIEVVELFWYGCPHCKQLEPLLDKWLETKPEDVNFIRMPAILGPNWDLMARAFFTAELLGILDQVHAPLFERIHTKKDRKIHSEEGLQAFFGEFGVAPEKFTSTFQSFAVATKLNQARIMTRRYGITGVPALIVNGKYRTSATLTGGDENMLKAVDHLTDMERKAMPKPLADAKP